MTYEIWLIKKMKDDFEKELKKYEKKV